MLLETLNSDKMHALSARQPPLDGQKDSHINVPRPVQCLNPNPDFSKIRIKSSKTLFSFYLYHGILTPSHIIVQSTIVQTTNLIKWLWGQE